MPRSPHVIVPSVDAAPLWDVVEIPRSDEGDAVPEVVFTGRLEDCRVEYPGATVDAA